MIFKRKRFYICSVCGFDKLPGPLYSETGIPDVSLICRCCGFQSGFDDAELGYSFESYRNEWIQNGAEWFREAEKPVNWDLVKQLSNINIRAFI
ncbi:hypothetical protein [Niallia sp. FSL R7-0271]|uniref:hypothetical protein n=1 Tax=Niallia sp. FSL R7-0271 TaxID=2921678 RepID=UPI0030F529E0